MKIRSQVLLDAKHDAWLRREARLRKCSVSATLRQILDERLAMPRSDGDPFADLAGSVDGSKEPVGRNADTYLYGEKE